LDTAQGQWYRAVITQRRAAIATKTRFRPPQLAASFIKRSRDQAQEALTCINGDRLDREFIGP